MAGGSLYLPEQGLWLPDGYEATEQILCMPSEEEIALYGVQGHLKTIISMPVFKEDRRSTDEYPIEGDNFKATAEGYQNAADKAHEHRSEFMVAAYVDGTPPHKDGTPDRTAAIARDLGLTVFVKEKNKYRGEAYLETTGETVSRLDEDGVIAYIDGDGSYSPKTVMELVDAARQPNIDASIAYRDGGQEQHDGTMRYLVHVALGVIREAEAPTAGLLHKGSQIRDSQAGAFAFRRDTARFMLEQMRKHYTPGEAPAWATNHIMWHLSHLAGMNVAQVPAKIIPKINSRVGGNFTAKAKSGLQMVADTAQARLWTIGKRRQFANDWQHAKNS